MPTDIRKTPVHLGSSVRGPDAAVPLEDFDFSGEAFGAYIGKYCTGDDPGRLVMVEGSPVSWPVWECHPEGDEVVIILSGKAVFIQELPEGALRSEVGPGSTVVNPAGVWHTADVQEPLEAVYITPARGTEHRER